MDHVDTIVIGAGVVGLAIARALAAAGHAVWVLEADRRFGQGVSARSSEVIHAGLYNPPHWLKTRLCVRGRELMYAYCHARGVPHRRIGKLVIAVTAQQRAELAALAARATANGVTGLQLIDGSHARVLEPALQAAEALWSPDTGIVDSHALMLALLGDLEAHGGLLACASPVHSARRVDGAWQVRTIDGTELACARLVNAAGLDAQRVAHATKGVTAEHIPALHLARGQYFTLPGRAPFSRLIYPLPVGGGLGIHLTLDLGGQVRFGPDVEWVEAIDLQVDRCRARAFETAVRLWWPALPADALQPGYVGIRPKLSGPGEPAQDFRIDGPSTHGLPGLVNLFGIESPGLTASLAIGEYVAALLAG